MQALILAAGRGTRLGDAAGGTPKCLLEIGRRPIVEHQLDALSAAGVGPVVMMLGYGADEVRERVGLKAEYLFNREFATTNSLYSFWLARDRLKGDGVVVLNSDIIFDPRVLDRLLAAGGDAFAYDSGSGDGREHMKVRIADGHLADMGKDLPSGDASGENVGLLCFTEATAAALLEKAGALLAEGRRKDFLGAAVREIARERPIKAVDVAGLPWGEIDFPYDLERARKEVWPAIERATRRRRPVRRAARWAVVALGVALIGAGIWRLSWRLAAPPMGPLEVQGAAAAILTTASGPRRWNLIDASQAARVTDVGPGPVRVDSRVVGVTALTAPSPYVLEVTVDGRRLDWFKLTGRPSRTVRWQGQVVGKSRTVIIDLPKGAHELTVKLVAAESGKCLVRLRGVERDDEGTDDAAAREADDAVKTAGPDR